LTILCQVPKTRALQGREFSITRNGAVQTPGYI